jgi:hypothetical protein
MQLCFALLRALVRRRLCGRIEDNWRCRSLSSLECGRRSWLYLCHRCIAGDCNSGDGGGAGRAEAKGPRPDVYPRWHSISIVRKNTRRQNVYMCGLTYMMCGYGAIECSRSPSERFPESASNSVARAHNSNRRQLSRTLHQLHLLSFW